MCVILPALNTPVWNRCRASWSFFLPPNRPIWTFSRVFLKNSTTFKVKKYWFFNSEMIAGLLVQLYKRCLWRHKRPEILIICYGLNISISFENTSIMGGVGSVSRESSRLYVKVVGNKRQNASKLKMFRSSQKSIYRSILWLWFNLDPKKMIFHRVMS